MGKNARGICLFAAAPQRQHLATHERRRAVLRPLVHQPAALFEQIAPAIGTLDLAFDHMSKRHLGEFRG